MTMRARFDAFNQAEPFDDVAASYTMDRFFEARDEARRLEQAFLRLSAREERVLRLRTIEGLTLAEVGEQMGISRERVRGIEAKALRKLKHPYIVRRFGLAWPNGQKPILAKPIAAATVNPKSRLVEYIDVLNTAAETVTVNEPFRSWQEMRNHSGPCVVVHEGEEISIVVRGIATDAVSQAYFESDAVALFYVGGTQYGEDWKKVMRPVTKTVSRAAPVFYTKEVVIH